MSRSRIGAVAQEAKVRASIGTQGDLWVGQRVTLVVELLAPGFFSGMAAFDLPNRARLAAHAAGGQPDRLERNHRRHELHRAAS